VSTQSPASQTRHFHDSAELSRVRRRCPWARELRPDLRIGCLSAARPHETRKPRQRSIASSFWESLVTAGMASFADVLSPADAQVIHAFLWRE